MKINYTIIDEEKYNTYFKDKELVLVPSRPKDMAWLIAFGRVDGAITYNTVLANFPKVYQTIKEVADTDLRLCLIKRKGEEIKLEDYNEHNKLLIACEHVNHIYQHLQRSGLKTDAFSLDRVIGSSEGYMVNTPKDNYILCDAIVESGKTLDENNLEVWQVALDRGEVKIGLYFDIRLKN